MDLHHAHRHAHIPDAAVALRQPGITCRGKLAPTTTHLTASPAKFRVSVVWLLRLLQPHRQKEGLHSHRYQENATQCQDPVSSRVMEEGAEA